MPSVTTVIDDKSPLILYDPTWRQGTAQDEYATDYYLGTFTINNVTNGSVTFNFNGTAVWLYGANRPNHGSYTVQVDSATYSGFNGAGDNLFQQSLFNTSSLSQAAHSVKLTNTATGGLYVDIDMIVWQSQVGNTDDQLTTEVVQNTDSRFQYQQSWATTSSSFDFNLFSNGTGHVTQAYDANVTFTFTGEVVSLYGTSGLSNGPYLAQLDGGQTIQYNASNAYPTNYGVMIYHADNLGSGTHQLLLTNLPGVTGQSLTIDYAQLWTTADTTETSGSTSQLSSGAIAGIAIAVAVAVLSAGVAIFFYRRWKTALATHQDLYRVYTSQRPPPDLATVPPTGVSSSLETRSNASLVRNDPSIQALSGRVQQPANNHAAQYHGAVPVTSGSRNSRSVIDTVSSSSQPPADEGSERRPLPEAPGGGLSLSDEFPKLGGSRPRQSMMTVDDSSIAPSEAPPNYTQATGNAAIPHE
ncbi:hypothetical protein HD554DRAFT_2066467 [Boletus coccyginus]|nr:hypothetical protein HD554DRAFT_2066467 [Boletus coccyginus]